MLIFPVSGGITDILTYLTPAWATQTEPISEPGRTTVVDQRKQRLWDVSVLLAPSPPHVHDECPVLCSLMPCHALSGTGFSLFSQMPTLEG